MHTYTITLDFAAATTDEQRFEILQTALGQSAEILDALTFGTEIIQALPPRREHSASVSARPRGSPSPAAADPGHAEGRTSRIR